MNSGVKTSSDAPSDVTVFKPSLMLRINGWFGLVFGIVLSAAALEGLVSGDASAPAKAFLALGPISIGWSLLVLSWRLTVGPDTITIRNFRTTEIPRAEVAYITTENAIGSEKALGMEQNQAYLVTTTGQQHELSIMRRRGEEWTNTIYEDRLHKIAEAIGCEFRPPGPGDYPFFS